MSRVWPLMAVLGDFTAGPPAVPSGTSVNLLNGPAALRQLATQRGRQYELGQVQAGTMSLDLVDSSEYLNPASTTSPWNTGANSLLPYRCVQAGAWWNQATLSAAGNMLNATNLVLGSSSGHYDPSFESSTGGFFAFAGSPVLVTSTAQHFVGAQSLSVTYTAAPDTALLALAAPFVPLQTYTCSVYVFVPASHTVTAAFINYPGTIGTTIASATSSTTGAWQRLVMTGVPTAAFGVLQLTVASGTFSATVFVDAVQLELGGTASAFTTTGPTWNPIYTGYVERYPQTWDSAGFRGLKALECVDALSPLSRAVINQSYAQTIAADGPAVYMPLNDDSGPQAVQRPTGGQPMIGYTQLGSNSGAVNFAGDSFLDGSKALTVVQQNTNPVTVNDNTQSTWSGTRQGGLYLNPQSFTWEQWIKFSSGVIYFGAGTGDPSVGAVTGTAAFIGMYTSGGNLLMAYFDGATPPVTQIFAGVTNWTTLGHSFYPDGKWHQVSIQLSGSNWFATIDGLTRGPFPLLAGTPVSMPVSNLFNESTTYFGDPVSNLSAANHALYPAALTATQMLNHYNRGIGYLGELSGTRAARLLAKYWSSNTVTSAGHTQMSTDFYYDPLTSPGQAPQPVTVLAALQDIASTESGLVWVDTAGLVHFDARDTRYLNQQTSQFTFGENTAGGELPYLNNLAYDADPTYVYSEADLTAASGTVYTSVNATSQTNYGQRILSQQMYMANDWDVQQAANFYTQRYAQPPGTRGSTVPMRINTLTIDPASNPALWQAALSLDIGERVTVKRRTAPGTTISGDYYIEQISHNINGEASTWTVDYQLSPVFNPTVWILGDAVKGVLGSTTVCVY